MREHIFWGDGEKYFLYLKHFKDRCWYTVLGKIKSEEVIFEKFNLSGARADVL